MSEIDNEIQELVAQSVSENAVLVNTESSPVVPTAVEPTKVTEPTIDPEKVIVPKTSDTIDTDDKTIVADTTLTKDELIDVDPKDLKESFNAENQFSKKDRAFADMRIHSKQNEQFILRMANVAGANVKTAKEALEFLEPNILGLEAKTKNIDPTVLKELSESRAQIAEMQAKQLKQDAIAGFSKLKNTHGLSDKDLVSFTDELIIANKNPFVEKMDIEQEYIVRHYKDLLASAREEGRQAEIARSKKANESSSNPGTSQGTQNNTGGSTKSIKTPADLEALFKSLGK